MMQAWRIENNNGICALTLSQIEIGKPGPSEVRIKVHASSINRRDYNTVKNPAERNIPLPRIPNSDAAGAVLAVGKDVTEFKPGDRVVTCFFKHWEGGKMRKSIMESALGGAEEGVLAEEIILPQTALLPIPDHLTFEEASTLTVAGVTAWNGLVVQGNLKAGDTVLIMGTGGVSIFALQFAKIMGARVIITSKSNRKIEKARDLGADEGVNYAENPNWDEVILDLTKGMGVDQVIEVGGPGTLQKSINATAFGGHIAMIGSLVLGTVNVHPLLRKSIRLSGIFAGSRDMFRDMNAAISATRMKPVIHQVFPFLSAQTAYKQLGTENHFGKLVISLSSR
tara:strand:- start:53 stop:1069 length:1017 start_codon:yes stop_codon:yes gene_type:complete